MLNHTISHETQTLYLKSNNLMFKVLPLNISKNLKQAFMWH